MSTEFKPDRISFSSLHEYKNCSWFYKLKNLDKIAKEPDTIWTHYGKLLHKWVQLVLEQPDLDVEEARNQFIKTWYRFCRLYKRQTDKQFKDGLLSVEDPFELYKGASVAIRTIRDEFTEQFGKYEIIDIEEYFRLQACEKWPQDFSGLIDISLKLEDGTIVVADFKTCASQYMFNKYKDKYKDYQITLYKHFFCKKHEVDPKTVETYFITIERIPKGKKPIQFTKVTSGPKKVENALKWLSNALAMINKRIFFKNRSHCHAYNKECIFYKTPHCP